MPEFQRARLIPVSGIDSVAEAETRAASAVLAVLSIVRPLSKSLLDPLGAPRASNAKVETFIEVLFDHEGRRIRPDGVIRVSHGIKTWTALVEVKTSNNCLDADQVNMYWDVARAAGYQAVMTISSEIPTADGLHPTAGLKVRGNSAVQVHHLSWAQILSEAVTQMVHRGVDDIEQGWILEELIRYLKHRASGALNFEDMGPSWVEVRGAARDGTVNRRDPKVIEVVSRWSQLLQYAALRLGAEIGQEVHVILPNGRKIDPAQRTAQLAASLAETGVLDGALRVPNTAGVIELYADLRAQQLTAVLAVDPPRDRGGKGRATWMVNQLAAASDRTVVETWARNARTVTGSATLAAAREDRSVLLPDGKEPVRFRVVIRSAMGIGRKAGTRSPGFVDTVLALLDEFYEAVVQNIRPWQAPAPKRQAAPPTQEMPPPMSGDGAGASDGMQPALPPLVGDQVTNVIISPAEPEREPVFPGASLVVPKP